MRRVALETDSGVIITFMLDKNDPKRDLVLIRSKGEMFDRIYGADDFQKYLETRLKENA